MAKASHIDPDYIRQLRRERRSWSVISRMTGASEVDLRRLFDGLVMPAPPPPPKSRQQLVVDALKAAGVAHGHSQVIARLWEARGEVVTAVAAVNGLLVNSACGGGGSEQQQKAYFKASLAAAKKLGIELLGTPTKGALTPRGVSFIDGLAGLL